MVSPLAEALAFVDADLAAENLPEGTTSDVSIPVAGLDHTHVQVAWDGTPTDADNREDAAVRFTVWGPPDQLTGVQDIAAGLRRRLLAWSSADTWRVDRGAGRLPGIDPDTQLPFCTFTVTFVIHVGTDS